MTQSILDGNDERAVRLSQNDVSLTGLTSLIMRLRTTLAPQQPSDRFVRQLKQDLLGEPQSVLSKLNTLPARVRIATGVAAGLAGLMWISRRHVRDEDDETPADLPALQQGS
jgi:hypothetical protein